MQLLLFDVSSIFVENNYFFTINNFRKHDYIFKFNKKKNNRKKLNYNY